MKTDLKACRAEFERRQAEHNAAVSKSRKEIQQAQAVLTALNEQLEQAQELPEYEKTRAEIKEQEAKLAFLNKRAAQADIQLLSDPEFKSILAQADADMKKLQEQHAPLISKKLSELIELLDKYTDAAYEIEAITAQARQLNKKPGQWMPLDNSRLKTREIGDLMQDAYFYNKYLLLAYYKHRNEVDGIKANPEHTLENKWINGEVRGIAQAAIKDRR